MNFCLRLSVQTGSGAHPTSYPMGTGGALPRIKRPKREADSSPPSSAEVCKYTRVYQKVSGLAAPSQNCKW